LISQGSKASKGMEASSGIDDVHARGYVLSGRLFILSCSSSSGLMVKENKGVGEGDKGGKGDSWVSPSSVTP